MTDCKSYDCKTSRQIKFTELLLVIVFITATGRELSHVPSLPPPETQSPMHALWVQVRQGPCYATVRLGIPMAGLRLSVPYCPLQLPETGSCDFYRHCSHHATIGDCMTFTLRSQGITGLEDQGIGLKVMRHHRVGLRFELGSQNLCSFA